MKRLLGWAATLLGALAAILVVGLLTGRWPMPALVDAIRAETQLPTGNPGTLRGDALALLWMSAEIPGTVAYCHKYIEKNNDLLAALKAWNDRNQLENERIVDAAKRSGGLSAKERDDFDRAAGTLIERKVKAQNDKVAYCRELASSVASGQLDLGKRQDTAEALKRIRTGK